MKKTIILLAVTCLITSCASSPEVAYFPNLAFSQWQDSHNFTVDWYGKHLRSMREPSLSSGLLTQTNSVTWRLMCLPNFAEPICYRIHVADSDGSYVVVKRTDGKGGYDTGKVILNQGKTISPDAFQELQRLLKDLTFWTLPVEGPKEIATLDGTAYVLEVADHGRYHVITRTSPGSLTPDFVKRCRKELPSFDIDAHIATQQKYEKLIDAVIETTGVPLLPLIEGMEELPTKQSTSTQE